jgi:pimeloyl-ACP methyl ester carboxylesterase
VEADRLAASIRSTVGIRIRTLAVLSVVLNTPVIAWVTRHLTREPRVECTECAGTPVSILRPGGRGPWPAIMFVNGAHPLRRKEPVVERVADGLARAGYLVIVPDLPGLGVGEITMRTVEAAAAVIREATSGPDLRGGRIALIGASTGASIAILLAARPELARRISLVSSVTPYADLRRMICLATTTRYEHGEQSREYGVTNLLRRAVARSMVVTLSCDAEREMLLARVGDILEEDDPFTRLPASAEAVDHGARAIVRLLENRDVGCFDELWNGLPGPLRAAIDDLSPSTVAGSVHAHVEMAVPPRDRYFPVDEAEDLARSLPSARLTVTSALDHTRPGASLRELDELRAFGGFVVRTLAGAAS